MSDREQFLQVEAADSQYSSLTFFNPSLMSLTSFHINVTNASASKDDF